MNALSKITVTLLASAALALTFTACSPDNVEDNNNSGNNSSSFTDKGNDISNYKIVTIGTQTWMAENLNYAVDGSKCYGEGYENRYGGIQDIQDNCDKLGRLYDWATAMNLPSSCNTSNCAGQINIPHQGICPSGWHIPTKEEWEILGSYVINDKIYYGDARYLMDTSWIGGLGVDSYGFAALQGGKGTISKIFPYEYRDRGFWWSATEFNADDINMKEGSVTNDAYALIMNGNSSSYWGLNDKEYNLFSVRCVKD